MTHSLSGAFEGSRASPQTGRPSNAPHRVAIVSFGAGYIRCECGADATVTEGYDRDEAVVAAWLEHRRDVGAVRAKFRGDVLEAM